jgi:hypothetical protein
MGNTILNNIDPDKLSSIITQYTVKLDQANIKDDKDTTELQLYQSRRLKSKSDQFFIFEKIFAKYPDDHTKSKILENNHYLQTSIDSNLYPYFTLSTIFSKLPERVSHFDHYPIIAQRQNLKHTLADK